MNITNEQEEKQSIYKRAISKFGYDAQVDMLIEEMAELTQALLKQRWGKVHNIEEEYVDVSILLKQLSTVIDMDKAFEFERIKLNRLNNLISLPCPSNT